MIRTLLTSSEAAFSRAVGRELRSTRLRSPMLSGQGGRTGHGEQTCVPRRCMMAKAGKGKKKENMQKPVKAQKTTGGNDAQVALLARILDAPARKM